MSIEDFSVYDKYFSNNEGVHLLQSLAKPEILQNPYPYYHYLYSKGPVTWVPDKSWPSKGYYMIHDYSIINELLKSTKVGHDNTIADWDDKTRKNFKQQIVDNPHLSMSSKWMLIIDPPEHTKIRSLMNKVFTPGRIRELSDSVYEIANSLLDSINSRNNFDLLSKFAFPLPVLVIASLLGVPSTDLPTFKKWTSFLILKFKFGELTEEENTQVNKTTLEIKKYFGKLLSERESNPVNDLISALAQEKNPDISKEVMIDNLVLLLIAGHETTMNLIANGTYHLLNNPDQLSILRNDADLFSNMVEESLRYDSPVQSTARRSYAEFDFNGFKIESGLPIQFMLASANRNVSSNPNPDVFDITREKIRHVSFGGGIHYCLGAPLARLEAKIAFECLLAKYKNLQLAEQPVYRNHAQLRGFNSLILKN